jgi:hypothetical protein
MIKLLLALVVLLAALPVMAAAQQVNIQAPPPPGPSLEPGVISPPLRYERTLPENQDLYPPGPRVIPEPGFIGPLSVPTETGRAGIAGWTQPKEKVGGQITWQEVTGYFSIGYAFTWGAPPTPLRPRPAATTTR